MLSAGQSSPSALGGAGGGPGKPFHVQKLRESFHLAGLFLKPVSFRLSLPAGSSNVTATAELPGLPQPRRLTCLR